MALFYYKLKSSIIISFCSIIFYQCSQNNLESEGAQDNILNKELFSKILVEFALAESKKLIQFMPLILYMKIKLENLNTTLP
ncbi:MAG: hypothetical protein EBT39_06565 [Sphingobacteriia bacterium]|nr:hypothetical protein [Candidatus Fonsibacter lacus]